MSKASFLKKLEEGGFVVPSFFVCDSSWSKKEILRTIKIKLPGALYFAVRSSAEGEDSKHKSFAGHFHSSVGVPQKRVFREIAEVQRSFGTIPGKVIVQEFIPSDIAGVMFTEVDQEHIVINALSGLCLSVVDGNTCDEYLLDKKGKLIEKIIPQEKNIKVFKNARVTSQKITKESLNEKKIGELTHLAIKIQKFFGSPQDIEWCFLNNKLYVLQARPITCDFKVNQKEYFDSANIAESYSGIVLPLTCSFAKLIYEQAYKDLLRMSGVSLKKIENHSVIFKNLLSFFYGRIYYNMNNWYHMTSFVPGYKRNKVNFELMITSNVRQNIAEPISPSIILKIFYPFIVLVKICLFGAISRHFKRSVRLELGRLKNCDFKKMDHVGCIDLFNSLRRNLLCRWYITVENDFLVMTHLGILKKIVNEKLLQRLIIFPSKTTEQVSALAELSRKTKEIRPLWNAIKSDDTSKFTNELLKNQPIQRLVQNYLNDFGGRFANELKLESPGIDEDRAKLLSILKLYDGYKFKNCKSTKKINLSFLKRIFLKIILAEFKKYARQREEFRLLRSNTFAVARHVFKSMGELLVKENVLLDAHDVFYLRIEEILNPLATTNKNLKQVVKKRKEEYDYYKKVKPPAHFEGRGNSLPHIQIMRRELKNFILEGRPASPGIIRGKVRVFKEFLIPQKIDFDILVAEHTDPGWASLIALSKGLIIEHGGVLSHASIIARELGIPAVIGATNAISFLKDNQIVEINGSTGTIKII